MTDSGGLVHVIDDDEPVRDSMCALLEACGFNVRQHASAHDFLDTFETERAGCLVVDVHMGGMSGIELLEFLKARPSAPPVIIVSGRADPALTERAVRAGAMAVLRKPADDEELIGLIERALGNKT